METENIIDIVTELVLPECKGIDQYHIVNEITPLFRQAPQLAPKYVASMGHIIQAAYTTKQESSDLANNVLNTAYKNDLKFREWGHLWWQPIPVLWLLCTPKLTDTMLMNAEQIKGRELMKITAATLLNPHYEPERLIKTLHYITNTTKFDIVLLDRILNDVDILKELPVEWWLPMYIKDNNE